jgi:Protein of unknown function (DUF3156)
MSARRAAAVLRSDTEAFERLGYRPAERGSSHSVVLTAPEGGRDLVLRLRGEGRIFGGNWGLELSPVDPLLPRTGRGLTARGRGAVKLQGVKFRARRGDDEPAPRIAAALTGDAELGEALGRVHFERVTVEPDGRPVIRHLGGSVVWLLFPPMARATPLPPDQPRELISALDAFARAGERLGRDTA